MSGIAGIVRKDGTEVDSDALERCLGRLDHRGPDGSWMGARGAVGVGQQRFETTPESSHEETPLGGESTLLTADVRLDNRAELIRRLDVSSASVITDPALLLQAYDEWGADCPIHLIGAYAFAIWDGERERLFCARDHAGLRPFFYYDDDDVFVFGSEIGAILRHDAVPCRLDERTVGAFLYGELANEPRTFYEDLTRLPPAHSGVLIDSGFRSERYWSLDAVPSHENRSRSEWIEGFRDRFRAAVRCRLRSGNGNRVATTLTGGIDSSSIAATAEHMLDEPLRTMSLTFESVPDSDEQQYIDRVLDSGAYEPAFVRGDRVSPMGPIDEMVRSFDVPFLACNLYLHWVLYQETNLAGSTILLGGFGGDSIVSYGLERLMDLATSARWITLAAELESFASRTGNARRFVLYQNVIEPWLPGGIANTLSNRSGHPTDDPGADVVDGSFARWYLGEVDIPTRQPNRSSWAMHRRALEQTIDTRTFELATIAGARNGVEPRFPFFDRRLMEYCLAVPASLKLRNGWDRWILRASTEPDLPEEIRWRSDKATLTPAYRRSFRTLDRDSLSSTVEDLEGAGPFVDQESLREFVSQFLRGEAVESHARIWRPVVLNYWLRDGSMTADVENFSNLVENN